MHCEKNCDLTCSNRTGQFTTPCTNKCWKQARSQSFILFYRTNQQKQQQRVKNTLKIRKD